MVSIASASGEFGMLGVGEDIKMVRATQYDDSFQVFVCPNTWTDYVINVYKDGVKQAIESYFSETSDDCMDFNTKNLVSDMASMTSLTLDPSTTYEVKIMGRDPATRTYSSYYSLFDTTAGSYECNQNELTCIGLSCTLVKGSCHADLNYVKITGYDVRGNVVFEKVKSSWGSSKSFSLPDYNKAYLIKIYSSDNALTKSNTQYIYHETGSCVAPSFITSISSQQSTARIDIVGSVSEYSSFSWTLYKYVSGTYQYANTGTTSDKTIMLSGLYPSTSYRIAIQGNNACSNGKLITRDFTTIAGTINNFTISKTYSGSDVNVSVSPNVSASYEFMLYTFLDGNYMYSNTTSNPYYVYTNAQISYGVPYLVVVKSVQASGIAYNQTIITLDATGYYSLHVDQFSSNSYDSIMLLTMQNILGENTTFPYQRFSINHTWNSSTESKSELIWYYGGVDELFYQIKNLTASASYTYKAVMTDEGGFTYNATKTWTTPAINTSDYQIYFELISESAEDYSKGLRDDVNAWVYVRKGLTDAENVTYRIWDNESGVPFLIKNSTMSITGSPIMITNLLPERNYVFECVEPIFKGITHDPKNFTMIPARTGKFSCANQDFSEWFDAQFTFSNDQINIMTDISESADAQTRISTIWMASVLQVNGTNNYSGVVVDVPSGYSVYSHKNFLGRNEITSFEPIGIYPQNDDKTYVWVTRSVTCVGDSVSKHTFSRMFEIDTAISVSEKFGAFQGLYNLFDDLFPSQLSKFIAVMGIAVCIGLIGWFMAIMNEIGFSWAIGLTPIVLAFVFLFVIDAIPIGIFALIILALIGVLLFFVGKAVLGG